MKKIILLFVLLYVQSFLFAQTYTITGKIVDSSSIGLKDIWISLYIGSTYHYTISDVNGNFIFNNITEIEDENIPTGYSVSNNYPNPFNPTTRIAVTTPTNSKVRVNIYNLLGQKVSEEKQDFLGAGTNFLDLELNGKPNGFYIAQIVLDEKYTITKKLMLLYGSQHLENSSGFLNREGIPKINKLNFNLIIDSLIISNSTIHTIVYKNIEVTSNPFDLGTIVTESSAPTLASPTNGAIDVALPPTLRWNSVKNAYSYHLRLSTLNNVIHYDTKDTSQEVLGLSRLTKYFWNVFATIPAGYTEYSNPWSFTTEGAPPCPGTPTVIYLGKTYNTVLIGTQCWLRENLVVGLMLDSGGVATNNGKIEKYCYNNDPNNCITYGGLYQWYEAMQYTTTEGAKGICPEGWHIPTKAEFQTLVVTVNNDGNALKAIGQGSGFGVGTNTSGFSALIAGYRDPMGNYLNLGYSGDFWSSTKIDFFPTWMFIFDSVSNIYIGENSYELGYSVRCIKD